MADIWLGCLAGMTLPFDHVVESDPLGTFLAGLLTHRRRRHVHVVSEDLGYVPQVDVLGDVVGKEVGEDVPLTLALPGLRLAAEQALIIPLTPVNHDVVLEDAKGFVVQPGLHPHDG